MSLVRGFKQEKQQVIFFSLLRLTKWRFKEGILENGAGSRNQTPKYPNTRHKT